VGIGLLHGFVTVNFSMAGSLAPHPILNLEDHVLQFVWAPSFYLSDVGVLLGAYAPASIALRVIEARKTPLHDKEVVLKETVSDHEVRLFVVTL
jgi:hypothetical protein